MGNGILAASKAGVTQRVERKPDDFRNVSEGAETLIGRSLEG